VEDAVVVLGAPHHELPVGRNVLGEKLICPLAVRTEHRRPPAQNYHLRPMMTAKNTKLDDETATLWIGHY
jgi:hypothetical protein